MRRLLPLILILFAGGCAFSSAQAGGTTTPAASPAASPSPAPPTSASTPTPAGTPPAPVSGAPAKPGAVAAQQATPAQAQAGGLPQIALPIKQGSLKFAVIGDSGSGDREQYQLA